jgi:N-acetyl-1-D-myo-inositol-2-amino-2-deoxy-alpha-D-glucopyranoside deacetylase
MMAFRKVLLAVLAHPDDETFGVGGKLALYAKRGVDVYLICATRGEAGIVEKQYLEGFGSIAELREAELRCAAKKLGLHDVIFLGYCDSGMPGSPDNQNPMALINAEISEIALKINGHIQNLKPQVVLTFDEIGGYMHPYHICVHQATRKAFYAAVETGINSTEFLNYMPQKLYYYTISKKVMRWLVRVMPIIGKDPRSYGQNGDIDLRSISKANFPLHAKINYAEVSGIRTDASYCYASQGGKQVNKGASGLLRGWSQTSEIFVRDYPTPVKGHFETDLFEGVTCVD